jgi:hypothetical protein
MTFDNKKKHEPDAFEAKALKFFKDTGTSMTVEFLSNGFYFRDDKDRRDIYRITLVRGQRSYTFKFGQSVFRSGRYIYVDSMGKIVTNSRSEIHKYAKRYVSLGECVINKDQCEPTAYDVLTALTRYDPGTFGDFCSEYGYSADSKSAEDTYNAVVDEYKNLRILYSDAEIDQMQEIS